MPGRRYSGPVVEPDMFFIPLIAVLAPLLARGVSNWVRVPIVVFELVLGILLGPDVLGWVQPSGFVDDLSDFGLATLFFVAGSEINFEAVRGRPIIRASLGWLTSLVIGLAVGVLIAPGETAVIIAVALSSTALGTLMPILRDAGELHTPFGRAATAIGAVGEFGPLVAISLFLGTREPGISTLVLVGFVLVTGGAIVLATRMSHGRLHRFVRTTLHTSGQFAVRVIIMILAALVALSILLDLDMLLGAFAAGVIWKLIMRNAPERDREQVDSKIEAIAFGFLVPIFFVYTGVTFDLEVLLASPMALTLLPLFFVLLLVIRGIPSQLSVPPGASGHDRAALALLAATGLPIIVAVTNIGVDEGILDSALASALVGAGMLSVLAFPLLGMMLRARSSTRETAQLDAAPAEPTQEEA